MKILFLVLFLFLVLLICLILKLKHESIPNKWNVAICVIVPFCILGTFVMFSFLGYIRRKMDIHVLNHLNASMKLTIDGNKVFCTEKERTYYMDLLCKHIKQIDEIAENDSLISFCIGKNKEIDIRIKQAQKALKEQYIRCSRLNTILGGSHCYKQEIYKPNVFKVLVQDSVGLPTINIAFKLKCEFDSIESVQIQIYNEKDTLLKQSYKYNSRNMNCFVIPNVNSDSLLVKLGVIANVDGTATFVYTKYRTNE